VEDTPSLHWFHVEKGELGCSSSFALELKGAEGRSMLQTSASSLPGIDPKSGGAGYGEDEVSVPGSESERVAEPKRPSVRPKWARR
jgi:hypothetical protein